MEFPFCRSRALLCLLAVVLLVAAFEALALSIPHLRDHRDWINAARARMRGATYKGAAGVLLQARDNDCGAACLKMILAARGIDLGVPDFTRELRITPKGTSMLDLRLAASRAGVRARSWFISRGDLTHAPLPAIALIKSNHFVVIRRFLAPEVLEVDDPALGRLQWPVRSFHKAWSGETLIFDPEWTPH